MQWLDLVEPTGGPLLCQKELPRLFRLFEACVDPNCRFVEQAKTTIPSLRSGFCRGHRSGSELCEKLITFAMTRCAAFRSETCSRRPGLQPDCRITREQVRSHVLCLTPVTAWKVAKPVSLGKLRSNL